MNDFIKVAFSFEGGEEFEADILTSLLADAGFDTFDRDGEILNAYIPCDIFSEQSVPDALAVYPFSSQISYSVARIEGQDWNEEWEKNYFKPMLIADRCVIHSSFHKDYPSAEYEIVIDPKMAFGTGHHETTSLMVEQILDSDFIGKKVMDMGTGTGILAMLAKMRGAEKVWGIEIDTGAYDNAVENLALNNLSASDVKFYCGDASLLNLMGVKFDIFLANINRNIILNDMEAYCNSILPGGALQVSGFYAEDVPMLVERATALGLSLEKRASRNNWTMLLFRKA